MDGGANNDYNPRYPFSSMAGNGWHPGYKWLYSEDHPGGYVWGATGERQEFKLYAVCTRGPDAGKSFGYVTWGHTFFWGFVWSRPTPAAVQVTRWVEGVSKSGTMAQNVSVDRTGLAPLPGGVAW